jgi:hypothetical protein
MPLAMGAPRVCKNKIEVITPHGLVRRAENGMKS